MHTFWTQCLHVHICYGPALTWCKSVCWCAVLIYLQFECGSCKDIIYSHFIRKSERTWHLLVPRSLLWPWNQCVVVCHSWQDSGWLSSANLLSIEDCANEIQSSLHVIMNSIIARGLDRLWFAQRSLDKRLALHNHLLLIEPLPPLLSNLASPYRVCTESPNHQWFCHRQIRVSHMVC